MNDERIEQLINKFGPRLDVVEFTDIGIPHSEEVTLIRDLWLSLQDDERAGILNRLVKEKAVDLDTPMEYVPDQTPYAMRLLFYYMKMRRKNQFIS